MATQADVRRIALSLPETEEEPNRFAFSVRNKGKRKGFVWVWLERVTPKKARVPQPRVIAVRVASLYDKDFLLGLDPEKFFTEPHYNGYPAVLVRLPAVTVRELRPLIVEAWRCQAPKSLVAGT
ncbi:MAG: MmcQ/YjbR family DNA-binding protein [Gemmatimonadales bacterium]